MQLVELLDQYPASFDNFLISQYLEVLCVWQHDQSNSLQTGSGICNFRTPSSIAASFPNKGSPFPSITVNSVVTHLSATCTSAVNVPITVWGAVDP